MIEEITFASKILTTKDQKNKLNLEFDGNRFVFNKFREQWGYLKKKRFFESEHDKWFRLKRMIETTPKLQNLIYGNLKSALVNFESAVIDYNISGKNIEYIEPQDNQNFILLSNCVISDDLITISDDLRLKINGQVPDGIRRILKISKLLNTYSVEIVIEKNNRFDDNLVYCLPWNNDISEY